VYKWIKWCCKWSHVVLQWPVEPHCETSKVWKKAMDWCTAQCIMLHAVLSENYRKSHYLNLPISSRRRRRFWPSGDFLVQYFCDAFSWQCSSSWKHSKRNGRLLYRLISLLFLRIFPYYHITIACPCYPNTYRVYRLYNNDVICKLT